MTLWNPQHTVDDLHELQSLLFDFLVSLPAEAWSHKTGARDKDWTVQETVAHLLSISRLFQQGVQAALTDTKVSIPHLTRREDLRDFNQHEIARLSSHTPDELIDLLRESFADVLTTISQLTPDDYEKTADIYVYNRPTRVIDLVDFQLSHAGIIHASQIGRSESTYTPIWRHYSDAMTHRMMDRYFRHFSYAYWNKLTGDLRGAIQFQIGANEADRWYLWVSPNGSWAHHGVSEEIPLFTATVRDADVLFSIFTMHTSIENALTESTLVIHGHYPASLTLLSYFSASPPKRPLSDG